MPEPSISEIVGRPDAELGKGQPAAVLDINSGLQGATLAARDYSQNLLNKYAMFQRTLGQFAQNHQLDFAGVLREDIPALKDKAVAYFGKVASNPKMINDIGQDADWIDLQSQIAKSKQDNGYLSAQEEFRRMHPDLYNQTNDDLIKTFRGTPLETRQTFTLDLPKTIDFDALAKTALGAGQAFDTQTKAPNAEGYFLETKGKQYPQDQYEGTVSSIYNSSTPIDKYGHTPKQYADDHYGILPEAVKQEYERAGKAQGIDGQEAWFKDQMLRRYKPFDITDTQLVEDKYTIENKKLGLDKEKLALEWWKATHIDKPKAQAQIDLWKSNTIGGDEQKNAALGFATGVYNNLRGLANSAGVITPDKLRQLSSDQLKYLGINIPEQRDPQTGQVIQGGGLQPITLGANDAIEIIDGKIKVYRNARMLDDGTGRVTGLLDNKANTNIQNIATNKINEELKIAGSKELNAYLGADLMGQDESGDNTQVVSGTPQGTSTTSYSKSTQKTNENITLPATNGKVDVSKLQKGQSYNYNGKNYQWDGSKLIPE
jgi:hypothetical protein